MVYGELDCHEISVLQGAEARFLSSTTVPHELIAANEAFLKMFCLSSGCICGSALKSVYSDVEGYALVEEVILKAASGVECECAIGLSGHDLPIHMRAFPITEMGKVLIACEVKQINYCSEILSQNVAQAILTCKAPCHVDDANDAWCKLWGFSKEEVVGRSVKLLQGPSTNEHILADLLDAARKGLDKQCEIIAYTKQGSECAVRLRSRPIFCLGSPIRRFVIEALAQSTILDLVQQHPHVDCEQMAALDIDDAISTEPDGLTAMSSTDKEAEAMGSDCSERRTFAELVLTLPADMHHFCLGLLWRLREEALVQEWCWEEDTLRVRADTEALSLIAGIEGSGPNLWLLRLVEAAYRLDIKRVHSAGLGRGDLGRAAAESCLTSLDESATDFSFLSGDGGSPLFSSA